nr:putative protein TPRXL isoform X1 [Labrus bergylta]
MTSSSPALSSSSSSSSSSTSGNQLLSSSSSPLRPHLSLQSPELQAEFLRECQSRFQFNRDVCESNETHSPSPVTPYSPLPSPFSPAPTSSPGSSSSSSSSSPCFDNRRARLSLSLSSPELLSELKHSRTRSLRHVPAHKGLTTVFSGQGRGRGGGQVSKHKQVSGPASSTQQTNQKTSR